MEKQSKVFMIMKPSLVNFVLGLILFVSFGYFSLFAHSFLSVFILIAYISYHKFNSEGEIRNISRTSLVSIFLASIIAFSVYSIKSYGPRDWDFTCFFLYGNVATSGMNFYSPHDYYAILETLHIPVALDAGFMREVIDVGCPYPPPTLFLFSILGLFSYDNALIVWTIINYLFLIGSIVLIRNIFFKRAGFEDFMISIILILSFHSTLTTVFYANILFILLFILLLFYYYRDKPVSGVFLAIAIFLKPFTLMLFFYYIVKIQKKAISLFILSCLFICFITVLVFGVQPFIEYLLNNPTLREPESLFTESTNQSFLAELYRNLPDHKFFAKIIYYIVSGIIVLMFGIIIYKIKNRPSFHDLYYVILLSVSLLIYPSGQYFYPVVHLISVFILLKYFKRLDSSALFIFLFYLVSYSGLFYLNIFLLISSLTIIYDDRLCFLYSEISQTEKKGA